MLRCRRSNERQFAEKPNCHERRRSCDRRPSPTPGSGRIAFDRPEFGCVDAHLAHARDGRSLSRPGDPSQRTTYTEYDPNGSLRRVVNPAGAATYQQNEDPGVPFSREDDPNSEQDLDNAGDEAVIDATLNATVYEYTADDVREIITCRRASATHATASATARSMIWHKRVGGIPRSAGMRIRFVPFGLRRLGG